MLLSDSQIRAIDVANQFYDEYCSEEKVQLWTKARGIPREIGSLFFSGSTLDYLTIGDKEDGSLSALERVTFLEQITRRCGATLPIISDLMSLGVLSVIEVSDEVKELLHRDERQYGRPSFSFAFTEQGLFGNLKKVNTTVTKSGESFLLNGAKDFVASGQFLPSTFVITKDEWNDSPEDDLGMWFVPMGSPGVSALPSQSLGLEMVDPAKLVFENVALEESWRIPMDVHVFTSLQGQCRLVLCAACVGLAEAAYDSAFELMRGKSLKSYSYFGKSNGVLLAEMHSDLLAMRLMLYYMARCFEDNSNDVALTAANKLFICQTASKIAESSMSIAGYDGYIGNTRIARVYKDCMGMRIALGSEGVTSKALANQIYYGGVTSVSSV